MRLYAVIAALCLLVIASPASRLPASAATPAATTGPTIEGCPVFPPDNPWNRDVSKEPVDPNSAKYIASINADGDTHLHADFGAESDYGIPFVVVPGTQPKVPITFVEY